MPPQRIIVKLSPADIRKEGSSFDIAIAIGILAVSTQIPTDLLHQFEFVGELSLDGMIQHVNSSLATSIKAKNKLQCRNQFCAHYSGL